MDRELRKHVFEANRRLADTGLVTLTWGNVSGIDRKRGSVIIKPSGVPYSELTPEKLVEVCLEDGQPRSAEWKPSSDTPTHLALYRGFPEIGGIVHTHSTYAVAWSQAGREIPCLGTTHADLFPGPVPLTRRLTAAEIESDYEGIIGKIIVSHFLRAGLPPTHYPGVLLPHHGPFAWGNSPRKAVENAAALEEIAKMAAVTLSIHPVPPSIPVSQQRKHFLRKHGPGAYYGQDHS